MPRLRGIGLQKVESSGLRGGWRHGEAGRAHSRAEGEPLGGLGREDLGTRHGHEVRDTPGSTFLGPQHDPSLVSKTDKESKAISSSSRAQYRPHIPHAFTFACRKDFETEPLVFECVCEIAAQRFREPRTQLPLIHLRHQLCHVLHLLSQAVRVDSPGSERPSPRPIRACNVSGIPGSSTYTSCFPQLTLLDLWGLQSRGKASFRPLRACCSN